MCGKAVSNLGMLDQQIVIVLPDICVGEYFFYRRFIFLLDMYKELI